MLVINLNFFLYKNEIKIFIMIIINLFFDSFINISINQFYKELIFPIK